mmetsp:Transcript_29747/g.71887  ORF Transcript_29747/g.71887 Transcript_29747/m.71887 type:complete len:242 (+) Transcript_29747:431-1156(+)
MVGLRLSSARIESSRSSLGIDPERRFVPSLSSSFEVVAAGWRFPGEGLTNLAWASLENMVGEDDGDDAAEDEPSSLFDGRLGEDRARALRVAAASLSVLSACITHAWDGSLRDRFTGLLPPRFVADLRFRPEPPLALPLPLVAAASPWTLPQPSAEDATEASSSALLLSTTRFSVEFHLFLMALSVRPTRHLLISAHRFPNLAWASAMMASSSSVHPPLRMSGLRWLYQRSLHCLPSRPRS